MEQILGFLLGLLATLSVTIPAVAKPYPEPAGVPQKIASVGEGGVAPLLIAPASRAQTGTKPPSTFPVSQSPPSWLAELNQWRRMAGLPVIVENPRLSFGSEEHARYLVHQGPADISGFRAYDRRIGPAAHHEDSRRPSYSIAGAQAAIGGPLAVDIIQGSDVAWEGRTESADIDNLIVAPFHRLSLLAPWAQVAGYGSFGQYPRRAAALALRGPLELERRPGAIVFPPANRWISINALRGSEWPNSIAVCAGYKLPVGLPITLQTGRPLLLQSYSLRDQSSGSVLDACGFDARGYRNADATQQKRGRELLNAYGAITLIPRVPLSNGCQYRVTLETTQGRFEWIFGVKSVMQVEASEAVRAAIRKVAVIH